MNVAKFSRRLIFKIVRFGLERGFWKAGDVIGDPFGGVALGGVACAYAGLRWLGVELEEKFCRLGQANIEKHRRELGLWGYPLPVIVQGDSRQFAAIVGEALAGCVTSPPYAESLNAQHNGIDTAKLQKASAGQKRGPGTKHAETFTASGLGYSADPANIGNLPAGALDAALPPGEVAGVVTSPPYADIGAVDLSPKDIERMKANEANGKSTRRQNNSRAAIERQIAKAHPEYGATPGQIGNLPAGTLDGAVTSPPWADVPAHDTRESYDKHPSSGRMGKSCGQDYGTAPGQIGKDAGESYWQAVSTVYQQVYQSLKPGGVLAVVVKSYVKQKQLVDLPDQTAQLLTALGFDVFLRCRCWLVKESRHPSLFGGDIVETTERKSFFRRLAEKKGSPRIDWETVLFTRKV